MFRLLFWIRLILMICCRYTGHIKLCLHMCVWYVLKVETSSHLFFHYEMAWQLWNKLFSLFGVLWVCPTILDSFLTTRYCGFFFWVGKKRSMRSCKTCFCFMTFMVWKKMLKFLNSYISQRDKILLLTLLFWSLWFLSGDKFDRFAN